MTQLLLDSDTIIDVLKRFPLTVTFLNNRLALGDTFVVNDVVLGEVYSGLSVGGAVQAQAFLLRLGYLPTSQTTAALAGAWRYHYARQGRPLAITDCLIAATAYEHGVEIVTGNLRDFPMPEVSIVPLPRTTRRGSS